MSLTLWVKCRCEMSPLDKQLTFGLLVEVGVKSGWSFSCFSCKAETTNPFIWFSLLSPSWVACLVSGLHSLWKLRGEDGITPKMETTSGPSGPFLIIKRPRWKTDLEKPRLQRQPQKFLSTRQSRAAQSGQSSCDAHRLETVFHLFC